VLIYKVKDLILYDSIVIGNTNQGAEVMLKKAYCEEFIGKYSVPVRVAVALDLVKKYNYTQLQAARTVNIPQPLLNYVIHGRRRPRLLDVVLESREIRGIIESLADQIASGKTISMCDFCRAVKALYERPHIKNRLG
jgi:predicted transcriptional regulator